MTHVLKDRSDEKYSSDIRRNIQDTFSILSRGITDLNTFSGDYENTVDKVSGSYRYTQVLDYIICKLNIQYTELENTIQTRSQEEEFKS